jgi:hypothetical protein
MIMFKNLYFVGYFILLIEKFPVKMENYKLNFSKYI